DNFNDGFSFSVADSPGAAATGTFNITAFEVAATITANTALNVPEGTTVAITSSQLAATSDPGDPASELVYTVTPATTHGTLKLSGNALAVNGTSTQDDINPRQLTYPQDGNNNNDGFGFSVADSPGSPATGIFTITFTEAAATITAN